MTRFVGFLSLAVAVPLLGSMPLASAVASDQFIIVQSTTSTQNSGLYDAILPAIEAATGIEVRVVAVGTGQAIKNARNCDGDVLLVHAKAAEEAFVAAGFGAARTDLMYNDFVLVGPGDDPAGVAGVETISAALRRIEQAKSVFASRGDDSGTHKKEVALWATAGLDPSDASGTWYRETGSGMGATLNIAVGMGAYSLTDRATWIAFANKGDHRIVLEGDAALFNQYGIIPVSPDACPSVKQAAAARFVEWMVSEPGQSAIAAYRRAGQQLFFPNAPGVGGAG